MAYARKNLLTALLMILLLVVLFVPGAKALLLKTCMRTGLFNAPAKTTMVAGADGFKGLSFTGEKGNRLNTADLKGKVIFVNIWAVWCPPCVAEMGSIDALYNKLKTDPRFEFILADADSNLPAARLFMLKNGYSLPVYQLASVLPANLYSGTIPTTLIIDPAGNVVQQHEGIANYNTDAFVQTLKTLAHHTGK